MKKLFLSKFFVLPIVLLIFGFIFLIKTASNVNAACASGYHCVGTSVVDVGIGGCNSRCGQKTWIHITYYCNANCGYSSSSIPGRCNYNSRTKTCSSGSHTYSGNCCAKDSGGGGGGGCSASAPTNLSLIKISSGKGSAWRLSWTLGSGSSQRVYIGTNKTAVEGNCAAGTGGATGCSVKDEAVANTVTTYNVSGLTEGAVYYSRVIAYNDAGCNRASATNIAVSSCAISPSNLSIQIGQTLPLTTVVGDLGAGGLVSYTKAGTFVNINPASDNTSPYSTNVTGVSAGVGRITNTVTPAGGSTCTDVSSVTVLNPGPWWQAIDGDVTTNGDLLDLVPFTIVDYLAKKGTGGYPGVPVYGGTTDVTSDKVSETKWFANTTTNANKIFNSTFFFNSEPSDLSTSDGTLTEIGPVEDGSIFVTQGVEKDGYFWYEYDPTKNGGADLTLSGGTDVGERKVIVLVKNGGNVHIQGNINLTRGRGFFMLVANNIYVESTVGGGAGPNLEGIFVADGQFATGVAASQLYIHGTVAAYGGVSLERDLGGPVNATTPAEVFEYGPELELLYPSKLGTRAINWQEVAP